jgi:hypothetical protein
VAQNLVEMAEVSTIESALQSLSEGPRREPLLPFKPGLGALDPGETTELQSSQAERDLLIREIRNLRKAVHPKNLRAG